MVVSSCLTILYGASRLESDMIVKLRVSGVLSIVDLSRVVAVLVTILMLILGQLLVSLSMGSVTLHMFVLLSYMSVMVLLSRVRESVRWYCLILRTTGAVRRVVLGIVVSVSLMHPAHFIMTLVVLSVC